MIKEAAGSDTRPSNGGCHYVQREKPAVLAKCAEVNSYGNPLLRIKVSLRIFR